MDLLKALKPIEELEHKLSELYEWFCTLTRSDEEASAFFARLSQEELSHQQIVQYQKRIVSRNSKIFESIELNMEDVDKAILDVNYLRVSEPPRDLETMIRITLDFENSTAENYYRTAMAQANPDVAQFLQRLGLSCATHLKAVQEFAELRGVLPPTPPKRSDVKMD